MRWFSFARFEPCEPVGGEERLLQLGRVVTRRERWAWRRVCGEFSPTGGVVT